MVHHIKKMFILCIEQAIQIILMLLSLKSILCRSVYKIVFKGKIYKLSCIDCSAERISIFYMMDPSNSTSIAIPLVIPQSSSCQGCFIFQTFTTFDFLGSSFLINYRSSFNIIGRIGYQLLY